MIAGTARNRRFEFVLITIHLAMFTLRFHLNKEDTKPDLEGTMLI